MRSNAKWLISCIMRVLLMSPFMIVGYVCDKAVNWLDDKLPGG